MTIQQSVGTALAVSTTLPTTTDVTGYDALTFTPVGKIQSVPDLDGTYDVVSADLLTEGYELKEAGILRAGDGEFTVLLDPDDAGQAILEGAKGSRVALAITLRDGTTVYYRTAIVLSFKPSGIDPNSFVMATVNLAFDGLSVVKRAV